MELVANARRVFSELPPVDSVPDVQAQPEEEVVGWMREMGASIPSKWLWGSADELREPDMWPRQLDRRSAGDVGAEEWESAEMEEPPVVPAWEELR